MPSSAAHRRASASRRLLPMPAGPSTTRERTRASGGGCASAGLQGVEFAGRARRAASSAADGAGRPARSRDRSPGSRRCRGGRRVEGRRLRQDLLLDARSAGPGSTPSSSASRAPGPAERGERVGLPVGAYSARRAAATAPRAAAPRDHRLEVAHQDSGLAGGRAGRRQPLAGHARSSSSRVISGRAHASPSVLGERRPAPERSASVSRGGRVGAAALA